MFTTSRRRSELIKSGLEFFNWFKANDDKGLWELQNEDLLGKWFATSRCQRFPVDW